MAEGIVLNRARGLLRKMPGIPSYNVGLVTFELSTSRCTFEYFLQWQFRGAASICWHALLHCNSLCEALYLFRTNSLDQGKLLDGANAKISMFLICMCGGERDKNELELHMLDPVQPLNKNRGGRITSAEMPLRVRAFLHLTRNYCTQQGWAFICFCVARRGTGNMPSNFEPHYREHLLVPVA